MLGSYSAQCEHIGIPVNNQQHFWRLHIDGCRTGGGQTESMQPLWGPTSLLESQLRNWYCRNLHYGTLLQKWANQQHMVYWCGLMSPLRMIQILLSLSPFHSSYYLYFFFISHGHCGMFFFFFYFKCSNSWGKALLSQDQLCEKQTCIKILWDGWNG